MVGVELSATGNDGQFVLMFPGSTADQDVTVRVSRAGWEVVNDVLLDQRLPALMSSRAFEIIVCAHNEARLRARRWAYEHAIVVAPSSLEAWPSIPPLGVLPNACTS